MILRTEETDAVIFDLDGTLFDSMWIWGQIDIEFLGSFGIPMPDPCDLDIEGMSFSETAVYFKERFHLPIGVGEIKNRWNKMAIEKYRYEVKPKKGAVPLIEKLRQRKIPLGIASSNSRELIDAVLLGNGMENDFDTVVISCEVAHGKPSPDVYLLAAERLSADPSRCLVFEDVLPGIIGAKRAGMKVYGVEDRFSLKSREEKIKFADDYVTDFDEIELR